MHIEISQVVTQILAFLIVYWILKRYAWGPLLKVMDDRQQRIQAEFDNIATQKSANVALRDKYNQQLADLNSEAQVVLKDAQDRGRELYHKMEEDAHQRAKEIVSNAQAALKTEVLKAKQQLKEELVDMVVSSTQKVVEESDVAAAQQTLARKLINEELSP